MDTNEVLVRLGLFGGTFNPIHLGHLRAAVEVREAFKLDKILLIPSANPPHKKAQDIASPEDRLEMVRLAVKGVPSLEASDVELARSGPSFTIETLRYFQGHFGHECAIYFVVGMDAFSDITTWKSYKQLFATANFVVMTRLGSKLKNLQSFILTYISNAYKHEGASNQYRHPSWRSIFCFDITHIDISATRTRKLIREGRCIHFLVPAAVEDYINRKGLYR
jgi:nicotinate-nucleotide adenylyltransferase